MLHIHNNMLNFIKLSCKRPMTYTQYANVILCDNTSAKYSSANISGVFTTKTTRDNTTTTVSDANNNWGSWMLFGDEKWSDEEINNGIYTLKSMINSSKMNMGATVINSYVVDDPVLLSFSRSITNISSNTLYVSEVAIIGNTRLSERENSEGKQGFMLAYLSLDAPMPIEPQETKSFTLTIK